MQRECAEIGTAVYDGSQACRYESIDLADVRSRGVERVVDADVLHEVEMHREMAKDTLDRRHRRKNGVVKTIHGVKD